MPRKSIHIPVLLYFLLHNSVYFWQKLPAFPELVCLLLWVGGFVALSVVLLVQVFFNQRKRKGHRQNDRYGSCGAGSECNMPSGLGGF